MNFVVLIALVCLSAAGVRSQVELYDMAKRGSRSKFCGNKLAETLSLVCNGEYNEPYANSKKSMIFGDMEGEDYAYEQAEEPGWPFVSRHRAAALLGAEGHHRRFRRGAYDECCRKPCSLNELMGYCRTPPKY